MAVEGFGAPPVVEVKHTASIQCQSGQLTLGDLVRLVEATANMSPKARVSIVTRGGGDMRDPISFTTLTVTA
jgi:hypothetical protein